MKLKTFFMSGIKPHLDFVTELAAFARKKGQRIEVEIIDLRNKGNIHALHKYGLRTIPSFVLMKNEKPVSSYVGKLDHRVLDKLVGG